MRADREQKAAVGAAAAERFQQGGGDERAAVAPAPRLRQGKVDQAEIGDGAPAGVVEAIRGVRGELGLGELPRRLDAFRDVTRPTEVHLVPVL